MDEVKGIVENVKGSFWRMLLTNSFLIGLIVVLAMGDMRAASPETIIAVDPKISVAAPGESLDINVTVASVTSLYAFDVNMTFDPAFLNCTGVEEGPFLKQTGGTTWWFEPYIRNDKGYVVFGNSFLPPIPPTGASGDGDLATVTFEVLAEGRSPINFSMTALNTLDEEGVSQPIEHTAIGGDFIFPLHRDVAVTDISTSSSSVQAGQSVFINVTVENKGDIDETFSVGILYDSTEIDTKTVTDLPPANSEELSFSWDTVGVDAGTYTVKAVAGPLSGETDDQDNTKSVEIAVTAPPPTIPTELLVGIIIAAAVACAVIFLFMRRRRSTKP